MKRSASIKWNSSFRAEIGHQLRLSIIVPPIIVDVLRQAIIPLLLATAACSSATGQDATHFVRGKLYIRELSSPNPITRRDWRNPSPLVVISNGHLQATLPFAITATARHKPGALLLGYGHYPIAIIVVNGKTRHDIMPICRDANTLALSPNGEVGACAKKDDTLTVFDTSRPLRTQRLIFRNLATNGYPEVAFISDSMIAVTSIDNLCPTPRGALLTPSRILFLDLHGRQRGTGPCSYGVVAGDRKIAYAGQDDSGFTYSLDGRTWHQGNPQTFTGDDVLLVLDRMGDLVDSDGHRVVRSVYHAWWGP